MERRPRRAPDAAPHAGEFGSGGRAGPLDPRQTLGMPTYRELTHDRRHPVGTGEAARLAGVSRATVIAWYEGGAVAGYALPNGGHRRISLASLRKLLADSGNPTAAVDAAIAKNTAE